MQPLSQRECAALVVTWALVTHLYFKKYTFATPLFFQTLGYLIAAPAVLSIACLYSFSAIWIAVLFSYSLFYTSLLAITVGYRLSPIHPLAKFPGPAMAKVSKFWSLKKALTGKQHLLYKGLHDKYGPIVRIGPNEISISDVDAVPAVFGDGMGKGPLWVARSPPKGPLGLICIRDPVKHTRRRQAWNKAFTTASIKEYEPMLVRRVQQLAEVLESNMKFKTDLAHWLSCFTFDFMGDMMFGGGFELMREGDQLGLKRFMEEGVVNAALLQQIPWAGRLAWRIPKVSGRIVRLRKWSTDFARRRKERGSTVKDVFHHLINEDNDEGCTPDEIVATDGLLAIVAGSDTTCTALSGIFYYLMKHPAVANKLRAEIDGVNAFDSTVLSNLPYLNAVINEGLRLQPPVPTAVQRAPLAGTVGKQICGEFIPEGTAISLPSYVIHRDPRYFSPSPDSYIPERWLKQSDDNEKGDGIKYRTFANAFVPFAGGFANCVGKNLAIVEMRMVVSLLTQKFDMRFAEGYDPQTWDANLEDWLVIKTGELPVMISPRV